MFNRRACLVREREMFEVGDLVRVTDRAVRKDYAGLEGIVTYVSAPGSRQGHPDDICITVKTTEPHRCSPVGTSFAFWQSTYPLELVNRDPPVCEDWS